MKYGNYDTETVSPSLWVQLVALPFERNERKHLPIQTKSSCIDYLIVLDLIKIKFEKQLRIQKAIFNSNEKRKKKIKGNQVHKKSRYMSSNPS